MLFHSAFYITSSATSISCAMPKIAGQNRPWALYALTAGAFGIGVTEFVIMGLLLEVSTDIGVSVTAAGTLISGYAIGVAVGAPLLTVFTARWPRKRVL